jgi:extradiol dioxygenase family protein
MYNIDLTRFFYEEQLGCRLGRSSDNALIFQLGQHQIVAHKVSSLPPVQEGIYPRHFGLIFLEKPDFEAFIQRLNDNKMSFEIPLKVRYPGTSIEHQSFFLKDPSNNLLEFKYYTNASAIFGESAYHKVGE